MKIKSSLLSITFFLFSLFILSGCFNAEVVSTNAEKQEVTELTITSFLPPPHSVNTMALEPFIEEIEEVTEGRVTATFFTGSALGTADSQYDLAVTRTSDFSLGMHGYTPGVFPLMEVTELPFMGENAEQSTNMMIELQNEFKAFSEEHYGTEIAWLFSTDAYQIFTADIPVESPEDMKGLKIRSPSPTANEMIKAMGATPVSMPFGELYEAMQRGVVDGAMAPGSTLKNFQIGDVTSYITKGDFSTASHFFVFNPKSLENLQ